MMPSAIRLFVRAGLVAALLLLTVAVVAAAPGDGPGEVDPPLPNTPAHYGVTYLYPNGAWAEDDLMAMDDLLSQMKLLGVDTVIQTFPAAFIGTPYTERWLAFLDLAESHGVQVVAYLWPNRVYTGPDTPFYLAELQAFLDVVAGHPALVATIGLHEPLEPQLGISDDDLREFYALMKAYAPQVAIAHYMNNISRAEALRPDGWRFSDGMCDICIIWYYPSRYEAGEPIFYADEVEQVAAADVALVHSRDSDAEVWFLGQAFEQVNYPTPLRFPTPDEMKAIYERANQHAIGGFLWYAWEQSEIYDSVLADEDREAHRQMVGSIAYLYRYRHRKLLPFATARLSPEPRFRPIALTDQR